MLAYEDMGLSRQQECFVCCWTSLQLMFVACCCNSTSVLLEPIPNPEGHIGVLVLVLQELLESGYLTEVHKFSKFIHGSCTLCPEMVQAVPYWVDDESVRPSMLVSAPAVRSAASSSSKPNGQHTSIEVIDRGEALGVVEVWV